MKISINHIRYYRDTYNWSGDPAPQGAEALAERIGAQLGAIEEVIDVGSRYNGVIIAKVMSCDDHPNADRLHICKLDDGGRAQNVDRDDNGYVQVVCGAPNVREGLMVAWLPPGSTVPESVGKDPFVLEARPLRGVISNGMLASPRELALGDSHEGILEIDEEVTPGTDFAEYYKLANDVVFDIENKMFTHRPDCFGMLGVAREIAGIQQQAFTSPEWYRLDVTVPAVETTVLPLAVRNELPELVPRFVAIAMSDIVVKASPVWLQVALARLGMRPINNIVDFTNYIMYITGQPLHAYDYDKVKAQDGAGQATLVVRKPQAGEKIKLLSGKEIEPRSEAIMIATEKALIGVGGVMGGFDTEVDDNTKNIIIEVANFDMYSIRRTSMAHGLFTDAVTRFNKGQSPLQNRVVLAKIVNDLRQYTGGKVASEVIDDNHLTSEVQERNSLYAPVTVTAQFINERLGSTLSAEEMRDLLVNVECAVQVDGGNLTVAAPFWRTDIEVPEDVVEEVGRLYGFDRLPLQLPLRPMTPAAKNPELELKQRIRDSLTRSGANEVLAYSFVHGNLLQKVGQDSQQSYQLSNALSPDLQYYRQSLLPSLLERVNPNIKTGYDSFALFEIGTAHVKGQVDAQGLPLEFERIALTFATEDKAAASKQGAAYYYAKTYLTTLLRDLNISSSVSYEPLSANDTDVATPYFENNRAATINIDGHVVGRIGEYRAAVRKSLKLPAYSAGFELGIDPLMALAQDDANYTTLSRFPKVEQDICLKVGVDVSYGELFDFVQARVQERIVELDCSFKLSPIDIYQRTDDQSSKQITFRVTVASYDKTLRDSEVAEILDYVAQSAAQTLSAQRI
jgi:phenylalanyl-tRNA synthetase beta chain